MKKVVLSLFFMAFMQALIGQTHWVPVSGIQNNMTMSAVLYINGEEQFLDSIEIGAFCGEECRAAALPYEIVGERVYFLTIKGTSNEVITFRLYDHQMDTELDYVCDTTYTFVIDDIVGDYPDWFPIHFSAPVPSFVEQTIALAAGSNYCSFNVEITVNELKTALVEAFPNSAISIKSKNQTHTYNPNNHRWSGTFNTFDLSKMNIIKVDNDGEITLQGIPVDPTAHPVIISNGSNYIAFPLTVNMTPTQAFAGFAVDGDKIKSKTKTIIYNRGKWGNQIPSFEPGQGYIYISNSTESRPFIFPTGAK
jgi:hypothetical protein